MADFVQTLMTTLAVGSLYALIALGYTMVYGILQFINFAHSDIVVLGAWVSYTLAQRILPWLGISLVNQSDLPPIWVPAVILAAAMAFCSLVGFAIERLAYKPLRNAPRLNVLITAIGVSLLLQNVGQLELARFRPGQPAAFSLPFGPYPKNMPPLLADRVLFAVVGVDFHLVDAVVLGTAVAFMVGIQWLIFQTMVV